MSIAIKDFEMPQSCYNCNFCLRRRTSDYGYFGMCDLTNEEGLNLYEHNRSEDCPLVEAIPKADYENRLKADMVAMLEEISLEFDEQYYVNRHELHDDSLNVGLEQGQSIIQQKIDALKEQGDVKDNNS